MEFQNLINSKTLEVVNLDNKFTYLKTRIPPHKASLEQDFAKIQEAAQEDKTRRSLSEWFEKKTKNTFVHINSEFATCDELQMWMTPETNNIASTKDEE
ncbi:hypothetical protein [Sphingobacterium daejeonense]|uniref:hypothetical protein n=1 Tax=Sphingobacterium daejeonense TaxID=371142 RepID=UPI0010C585CA|nr:hypothetical protein [Sphingobacterium daejeonense]VTP89354.1 Uncharacterised protein [Sphingobacterium daejeonense]